MRGLQNRLRRLEKIAPEAQPDDRQNTVALLNDMRRWPTTALLGKYDEPVPPARAAELTAQIRDIPRRVADGELPMKVPALLDALPIEAIYWLCAQWGDEE